jgi:hypothetical protein
MLRNGETEVADEFTFPYHLNGVEFKFIGSYYMIVLNKNVFLEESP